METVVDLFVCLFGFTVTLAVFLLSIPVTLLENSAREKEKNKFRRHDVISMVYTAKNHSVIVK